MKTLKELQEQKGELVQSVLALRDKSNDDDHQWSSEDEQEWSRVNDALDELQVSIDAEVAKQERDSRAANLEASLNDNRQFGREDRQGNHGGQQVATDEHRNAAFTGWLRQQNGYDLTPAQEEACQLTGLNPNRSRLDFRLGSFPQNAAGAWNRDGRPRIEDRAGLVVGTNADGGFTVPQGFLNELERTMLAFNGPRQVSRILRTDTGNQMEVPTVDDTGNTGVLLAEQASIGSSVDPTFAQVLLDAYKYSSKAILVSSELLTDSAFNMGQLVPSLLGERLGRIQAAQFTTGTGSSQPQGVVTGSAAGKTAASATAITGDEIIDLIHSVDPSYRVGPSVGFMFHDGILKAIRKLKTTDLQYIWQPGFQANSPDMILGYPYTINQNMQATIATATKTMLFGDFSKFIIRDVATVQLYRLEERYRDVDQTGFIAFMRSDSVVTQTAAIKHMLQA